MKIALCKSHFFGPVSGADEVLVTYAIRLHQAGHDVRVVLLYKPAENEPFHQRLQQSAVPVSCIIQRSYAFLILRSLRRVVSSFFLFFLLIPRSEQRLRKIWQVIMDWISRFHYRDCRDHFLRSTYDLLHVFTPDTGAALMIRAGHEVGIPVLYHEMGTPNHLPALDQYYQKLERVLPLCSEVAALSPRLASQWSARFPFLPSVSVLPLIAEDCETLTLPASQRVRNKAETVFGYSARIEAGKGPLVLMNALAQLRQNRQEALVRMAGTGPAMQEVKARVRELVLGESWEFVGSYAGRMGCSAFMRSLDVFVLPSFAEGTSKSVIEAMAHGLPIIATNVGGLPDVLTEDAGILVPPGDSISLAKAMELLASDSELRGRMGQAARARYLQLFSPNAVLPVLTNTYSRLTGTRPQALANSSSNGGHPWEGNGNGKIAKQPGNSSPAYQVEVIGKDCGIQTENLRIAFAAPEYVTEKHYDGGLPVYLGRVARALAERGHDVHVVTMSHADATEFEHEGVMVHRVMLKRSWQLLNRVTGYRVATTVQWLNLSTQVYRKLRQLNRQKPFHLMQFPNHSFCGLVSILLLPTPHVLRLSSCEPLFACIQDPRRQRTLDFRLLSLVERLQARLSPYIYAPSRWLQQMLIDEDGNDRVRVVHTPMYLEVNDWDYSVYDSLLKDRNYLLFFGRLEPRKGVHVLAQALVRALEENPDMHAVLVGRDVSTTTIPSMAAYARSLCNKFGERLMIVDSLQHRQLYPVIANAKLVVLPSLADNLPNACLEAMALGKAVLGTTETSFDELITDNETGFLVAADNVDALAEKISYAWNHPGLLQIGNAARQQILEFAPQKTIPALLSYYQEVLQN